MLKRILYIFNTLLVIWSAAFIGYIIFEPEAPDQTEVHDFLNSIVNYEALKDYTLSSGPSAIHYYYFCSFENDDCRYLENTIMKSTARNTGVDLPSLIEYVDITALEQKLQTNRLKSEWNIGSYPAFVATRNNQDQIEVLNSLEWDPQSPISEADLTKWLLQNNLYQGAEPDTIDKPSN